jgi:hypothetical protein
MFKVKMQSFKDLTEDEKDQASNNGAGMEYAGYIRVIRNGETLYLLSDAMEPEDASFYRDLSWVSNVIAHAYELGGQDATKEIMED